MNGQHKADEAGGVATPLLVQIWQRALCRVLREDSAWHCQQQGKAPGPSLCPGAGAGLALAEGRAPLPGRRLPAGVLVGVHYASSIRISGQWK